MKMRIEEVFTCPNCSGHQVEEVMSQVVLSTPILEVSVDEEDVDELNLAVSVEYDHDNETTDGGEVEHFQCLHCGEVIARSETDLYRYLKEHRPE